MELPLTPANFRSLFCAGLKSIHTCGQAGFCPDKRGSRGLLFSPAQINREADWRLPEESLAIVRDSDRSALECVADPAEEPFLGSLHQRRRTSDADQGLDRVAVFEFSAEPLTPLGEDGQPEIGRRRGIERMLDRCYTESFASPLDYPLRASWIALRTARPGAVAAAFGPER